MEFYFGRMSGNSLRVALGLLETGAKFEPRPLDTKAGQNKQPDYLSVNPMGKVPALTDGQTTLWESNAINWYLAEKNPQAKLLPPSIEGRAAALRWMFFQAAHVTPAAVPIFRSIHPKLVAALGPADPQAQENGRKELARFLPVLEQQLAGRDWLETDFSLADVANGPHLWLLNDAGFDFSATPRLRAWLDRLSARPAFQKAVSLVYGDGWAAPKRP